MKCQISQIRLQCVREGLDTYATAPAGAYDSWSGIQELMALGMGFIWSNAVPVDMRMGKKLLII